METAAGFEKLPAFGNGDSTVTDLLPLLMYEFGGELLFSSGVVDPGSVGG